MIALALIFLTLGQSPDNLIATPREFNRIHYSDNRLYFAPYTGTSIFFYRNDSLKALTFGDNPLSVIEDFHLTSFFLYLCDGRQITKHYLMQPSSKTIYKGNSINRFGLTESGDVVVIDRRPDRILILDPHYKIRLSITDLSARDIAAHREKIYILTKTEVIVSDQHLNTLERIPVPQAMKRIITADGRPIIFTPGRKRIYLYDQTWFPIEFENNIRDIATDGDKLFVLEDYGNTVRIHNIPDH